MDRSSTVYKQKQDETVLNKYVSVRYYIIYFGVRGQQGIYFFIKGSVELIFWPEATV